MNSEAMDWEAWILCHGFWDMDSKPWVLSQRFEAMDLSHGFWSWARLGALDLAMGSGPWFSSMESEPRTPAMESGPSILAMESGRFVLAMESGP